MVMQRKGLMNNLIAENARNQVIDLGQFKTHQEVKEVKKPLKIIIKQARVDL